MDHGYHIRRYTDNGYKSLNKHLYEDPATQEHPAYNRLREFDHQLSSALKVRTTPHDLHVYTGTKHNLDPKAKETVKLHLPAYTSTSIEHSTAYNFALSKVNEPHQTSSEVPHHIQQMYHAGKEAHLKCYEIAKNTRNPHNDPAYTAAKKELDHHQSNLDKAMKEHYDRHGEKISLNSKHNPISKHTIKIHVPKGSHGAYIEHMTANEFEHEFVLHKGAKVHLKPHPKTYIEAHVGNSTTLYHHVWEGHLVHDGVKETE